MLKIKPIEDKNIQSELCETYHIDYKPDSLAYLCEVDEANVGFCQFGIEGECGHIYDFISIGEKEDTEALIILSRAVLSFMHYCETPAASFDDNRAEERLMRICGFSITDGKPDIMDLNAFFTHNCKG